MRGILRVAGQRVANYVVLEAPRRTRFKTGESPLLRVAVKHGRRISRVREEPPNIDGAAFLVGAQVERCGREPRAAAAVVDHVFGPVRHSAEEGVLIKDARIIWTRAHPRQMRMMLSMSFGIMAGKSPSTFSPVRKSSNRKTPVRPLGSVSHSRLT